MATYLKQIRSTSIWIMVLSMAACNSNNEKFDASGTFEADEVIVSSELNGKILALNAEEGSILSKDSVIGAIDAVNISLQKEQVEANIQALQEKTSDAAPQVRLLQEQLAVQQTQL